MAVARATPENNPDRARAGSQASRLRACISPLAPDRLQAVRDNEWLVHRRRGFLQPWHPWSQRAGLQVKLRDLGVISLVVDQATFSYLERARYHVRLDPESVLVLALEPPPDDELIRSSHSHADNIHARLILVVLRVPRPGNELEPFHPVLPIVLH